MVISPKLNDLSTLTVAPLGRGSSARYGRVAVAVLVAVAVAVGVPDCASGDADAVENINKSIPAKIVSNATCFIPT